MSRVARIVIAGVAHHITQRGNNQQDVFFVEDDKRMYLDLLHAQSRKYGFGVTGYCLMNNHVHVVGIPKTEDALAKAIGRTHFLYTQYINRMHGRSGHLWQNRFYSCPMDEAHTFRALSYVELNPVQANLAALPWDYPWSSAAAHCGSDTAHPVLDMEQWHTIMPGMVWREILNQLRDDSEDVETLRLHTRTGRPLGSDSFISKFESFLGRRLRPLPVGRPKGSRKQKNVQEKE